MAMRRPLMTADAPWPELLSWIWDWQGEPEETAAPESSSLATTYLLGGAEGTFREKGFGEDGWEIWE